MIYTRMLRRIIYFQMIYACYVYLESFIRICFSVQIDVYSKFQNQCTRLSFVCLSWLRFCIISYYNMDIYHMYHIHICIYIYIYMCIILISAGLGFLWARSNRASSGRPYPIKHKAPVFFCLSISIWIWHR